MCYNPVVSMNACVIGNIKFSPNQNQPGNDNQNQNDWNFSILVMIMNFFHFFHLWHLLRLWEKFTILESSSMVISLLKVHPDNSKFTTLCRRIIISTGKLVMVNDR